MKEKVTYKLYVHAYMYYILRIPVCMYLYISCSSADFMSMSEVELKLLKNDLDETVSQLSHKLVRLLGKQTDLENNIQQNCEV